MASLRAKTIAIIGAGPSGLIAAKYLLAERAFEQIVLFEQRSSTGGIWNYTPDERDEGIFTIPQLNSRGKIDDPVWKTAIAKSDLKNGINGTVNGNKAKAVTSFLSPIYENLETNIPRGLMGFSDLEWPQESQLFPPHQTVLDYIQKYGKDVEHLIRFENQVVRLQPAGGEREDDRWRVTSRELKSGAERDELYGAVIVANGHFIVPYVPDIEGIREWNEKYPGSLTHSKYFRKEEEYKDKKVIVVGNSASGLDISSHIASFCKTPLLWSARSASTRNPTPDPRKHEFPPISRFSLDGRRVHFEDGRVESDVDAVVFATGYFYSLPFLQNMDPPLIDDGSHVQHTYQHLFYRPRPTLSFLVLNQRIIPFPIAEAQSAVLARVYSGRLTLPSDEKMRAWEDEVIKERGNGRNFHLLPFPKDADYINDMSDWALSAPLKEGLENNGRGKISPIWREWEYWTRENFPNIRRAFGARGDARQGIRSMEELGFDFDEHQKKQAASGDKLI